MFDSFLIDNGTFFPYTGEHFWTVLWSVLIGISIILYARRLNEDKQRRFALIFGMLILFSQLVKIPIRIYLGVFDITEDLPLQLCNMLPFVLPFAVYFKKRLLWAILFMWVMAGTFQSLITPTLVESFPHYEYFRYWIVHCGLVALALYPIFVYGFKLKLSDVWKSLLALNILAFIMYLINLGLDSNYMYLMAKPPGRTLYDILGPWPWYILSLEFVALLLFSLLYLPFSFIKPQTIPD